MVVLKFCGPVHSTLLEAGEKIRESVVAFCVQVRLPPLAVAWGGAVSSFTWVLTEAVQPFVLVAVKVYIPGRLAEGLACVLLNPCGPFHCSGMLAGDTVDVSWRAFTAQVRVPPPALICGARVSMPTWADALAVQPLAAVAVSV